VTWVDAGAKQVTARNATFQQWLALLTNRAKRHRAGEFLVQGVRPVTLAVRLGWPLRALLYDRDRTLSAWAARVLDASRAPRFAVSGGLLAELGDKDSGPPEVLAIAAMPAEEFARLPVGAGFLGVVLDRPASPGNIGAVVRSADAFGASGVIITGHAADPYDPKSVRASTGSLFAVPVVRAAAPAEALGFVRNSRAAGVPISVAGLDERGTADLADCDLTGPTLLVAGNEAAGLSAAWRQACDQRIRIPITGAASSLNAASAVTVALYESARQRALRSGPARGDTP
jgi:TrmH family RNA methyltransferase